MHADVWPYTLLIPTVIHSRRPPSNLTIWQTDRYIRLKKHANYNSAHAHVHLYGGHCTLDHSDSIFLSACNLVLSAQLTFRYIMYILPLYNSTLYTGVVKYIFKCMVSCCFSDKHMLKNCAYSIIVNTIQGVSSLRLLTP